MVKNPLLKGVWVRISAPWDASEERLRQFHSPVLHLEISSGCESAGFQLGGALGLQKFLWLSKNIRTLRYSYPVPPSPLRKTCYRYMVNSEIIQTWTYLKGNIGEFMEACIPYQNPLPSVDGW